MTRCGKSTTDAELHTVPPMQRKSHSRDHYNTWKVFFFLVSLRYAASWVRHSVTFEHRHRTADLLWSYAAFYFVQTRAVPLSAQSYNIEHPDISFLENHCSLSLDQIHFSSEGYTTVTDLILLDKYKHCPSYCTIHPGYEPFYFYHWGMHGHWSY